jgi:hypothetical protein
VFGAVYGVLLVALIGAFYVVHQVDPDERSPERAATGQ